MATIEKKWDRIPSDIEEQPRTPVIACTMVAIVIEIAVNIEGIVIPCS